MSEEVRRMFAGLAEHYDRINSILSLGLHQRWRKTAVILSGAREGFSVLDCATGTGDLLVEFKKRVGESGEAVGIDFCAAMIKRAADKARRAGVKVSLQVGDVLNLPYEEKRFDIAGISFGIRNVDQPLRALKEMVRVVKTGGTVVVLELGQVKGPLKLPYRCFGRYVIPAVGGLLSGNRQAYTYLWQSSACFPSGSDFLAMMEAAGRFSVLNAYRLAGGIAYIYTGTVS